MDRTILHCDCNSYFASVELLSHPELKSQPVAVCGDPAARHGVILAKNDAAKRYGVKTAEPIVHAQRKCPGLILLRPHHELYGQYCRQINGIYAQYTDLVEAASVDESYLDVTGSRALFGTGEQIANELRARVKRETGLTISVGVSFNKIFAKLGSDYKKPDATTVISRDRWRGIVWPLPVENLLFVGRAARKTLGRFGVRTIGDLAACRPDTLELLMGKLGLQLYQYANGLDQEPVRSRYDREPVKSVGNGTTFPQNLTTRDQVRSGVALLADSVAGRLRAAGMYACGVQVTLRTPEFQNRSRQKQLAAPTHLMRDLAAGAMELLNTIWKPPAPIRMLTVTAISLVPEDEAFEQVDLFGGAPGKDADRREKIEAAMDAIRTRYGRSAIHFGSGGNIPEADGDIAGQPPSDLEIR